MPKSPSCTETYTPEQDACQVLQIAVWTFLGPWLWIANLPLWQSVCNCWYLGLLNIFHNIGRSSNGACQLRLPKSPNLLCRTKECQTKNAAHLSMGPMHGLCYQTHMYLHWMAPHQRRSKAEFQDSMPPRSKTKWRHAALPLVSSDKCFGHTKLK